MASRTLDPFFDWRFAASIFKFFLSNGGVLQINIGLFGNQRLLASWNGQPRD